MMLAFLASVLLLFDSPAPSANDAEYREARARAGRDPEAHVRLALWCEARGMTAERAEHLAMAAMIAPEDASARGLMGLVRDGQRWRRPDGVAAEGSPDPREAALRAEYARSKERSTNDAPGQWALAQWCLTKGLKDEAIVHLTAVTRIDPSRAEAWRRLGFKLRGRVWKSDAQLDAERIEARKQEQATREWRPRLLALRDGLKRDRDREASASALARVTDPRAVPAVVAVFVTNRPADQKVAVQVLGQIDGQDASRALTVLALFAKDPSVRSTAVQTLGHRDAREFLSLAIGQMRDPIRYEVKHVDGPGSMGVLFVEGKEVDFRHLYITEPLTESTQFYLAQRASNQFYPTPAESYAMLSPSNVATSNHVGTAMGPQAIGSSPAALTQMNQQRSLQMLQASRDAEIARELDDRMQGIADAEMALSRAVAPLERWNAAAAEVNAAADDLLGYCTNRDFGTDRAAWQRWWTDAQGYASPPPEGQSRSAVAKPVFQQVSIHSCFAAGTPVRTRQGLTPIETVKVGDAVLSQDLATGALGFRPVVAALHNRPSATLKLTLDEETVVATGIHRFWRPGQGWTMARDLKVGDLIRVVGGTARVRAVSAEKVQPVFNLEVADDHSFFVGQLGALVHDNSLIAPTPEPFDAPQSARAKQGRE